MGFIKEFKEFALKGNVMDMAVGIIIGAAFGGVVKSVVDDLMMPVVGSVGKADFKDWFIPLKAVPEGTKVETLKQAGDAGIPALAYGQFITVLINFIIVAFCVFLLVKGLNRLKRKEEATPAAPPEPPKQEVLLTEIRDLLARR